MRHRFCRFLSVHRWLSRSKMLGLVVIPVLLGGRAYGTGCRCTIHDVVTAYML